MAQILMQEYASQVFQIGEDHIYFLSDTEDATGQGLVVAHAKTGAPYSRTTDYIRFKSMAEAEWFLCAAQAEDALPYGWQ
jgi:hypothetical protein